jgi:hypothetical protein
VTILELNHDPALEAAATAGLAGYQVSFELVAHTYAQLQQVLSSIRATRNTLLQSQGIDIVSGGLNEKANQVVVGISNPDGAAAGAYFDSLYGPGTVLVQPSTPTPIAATGHS